MKLTIISYETKSKDSYLFYLKYGDQELVEEIDICEGVVPYVVFSDTLQEILHKNIYDSRNMIKFSFKAYIEEVFDFPAEVGEF